MTGEGMRYFGERPHLLKLLDRAGIDRDRHGDGFPWLQVQRELFRTAKGLLAEGVATGEFQVKDLDLAVRGLLGTMRFQFLYPCDQADGESIPERIVRMLTRPPASSSADRAA